MKKYLEELHGMLKTTEVDIRKEFLMSLQLVREERKSRKVNDIE